ncbi:hypothetical protein DFJ43DRAFT_1039164 [Lentinula guzmanii]|uniref:Uncharacterized protein n=1 Tax=Lentinula guzmanii TaxID=2804957 RepID=A0AA38N0A0_9AGAR|nr:hypothetical protein DFJ43DRAFT_1039164 [Lentinula guzmanii]
MGLQLLNFVEIRQLFGVSGIYEISNPRCSKKHQELQNGFLWQKHQSSYRVSNCASAERQAGPQLEGDILQHPYKQISIQRMEADQRLCNPKDSSPVLSQNLIWNCVEERTAREVFSVTGHSAQFNPSFIGKGLRNLCKNILQVGPFREATEEFLLLRCLLRDITVFKLGRILQRKQAKKKFGLWATTVVWIQAGRDRHGSECELECIYLLETGVSDIFISENKAE